MKTLFSKLLIRFILIIMIVIFIFGFSLIYMFRGIYFSNQEDEIINNSQVILPYLSQAIAQRDNMAIHSWLDILARQNAGQAWIIDREGNLILSSPSIAVEGSIVNFDLYREIFTQANIITQRVEFGYFERPMLVIGLPIIEDNIPEYALLVFTSVAGLNSTVIQVQRMMLYSSILAIILALIVAYSWSKSLSNPLKKMSKIAIELSNGEFGKTIPIEEKNEIGTLAESINYMSKKLELTIKNLVEERNKLEYILTGMEEGVLAINNKKQIVLVNNSASYFLGIKDKDFEGKIYKKYIKNSDLSNLLESVVEKKEAQSIEINIDQNGKKERILIHCSPIYISNDLWGVVALLQDISERWRFEQLQKDFVANVSHELKAPLSSIRGAGEILLDKVVVEPEKQEEYLQMIIEEINRLEKMLNKVLDLSELDAHINYNKSKLEVNKLVIKVKNVFVKIINDEYKLILNLPEEPLFVKANKERLEQVLLNYLDNAYKFSTGGIIELGVCEEAEEIKIWVKDEGKGITEENLEDIWQRFYKVDKARTPDEGGSGLGLSIVKQIVEENHGRVFVESKEGRGSIFGLYLPKYV
ncbi:HAMP domain-containing sensor histidine kinase [Natronospora cellulosivora (SeqCode)]